MRDQRFLSALKKALAITLEKQYDVGSRLWTVIETMTVTL